MCRVRSSVARSEDMGRILAATDPDARARAVLAVATRGAAPRLRPVRGGVRRNPLSTQNPRPRHERVPRRVLRRRARVHLRGRDLAEETRARRRAGGVRSTAAHGRGRRGRVGRGSGGAHPQRPRSSRGRAAARRSRATAACEEAATANCQEDATRRRRARAATRRTDARRARAVTCLTTAARRRVEEYAGEPRGDDRGRRARPGHGGRMALRRLRRTPGAQRADRVAPRAPAGRDAHLLRQNGRHAARFFFLRGRRVSRKASGLVSRRILYRARHSK